MNWWNELYKEISNSDSYLECHHDEETYRKLCKGENLIFNKVIKNKNGI